MAGKTSGQPTILYRSLSKVNLRREQSVAAFTAALKAANLDPRHTWLFTKVAETFGIEVTKVEDYVMKGAHLSIVNNFFKGNGPRKLLWYYQMIDVDLRPGNKGSNREGPRRLFLTMGDDSALRGECIYFLRLEDVDLTKENIASKVISGSMSGDGILRSLQESLEYVMSPALDVRVDWGEIGRDDRKVSVFLEQVEKFVNTLGDVMESLEGSIVLRAPSHTFSVENKPAAFQQAAADPGIVEQCEGLVDDWCKDIDRVLAESDQVRKEDDNIGPNAELAHWKGRMAKFNAITDQLKSASHVKIVIGVLQAAKSKKLDQWKALHNRITDAANEAKDNVKYLYTLERFSEPLYKSDPVQMIDAIPGLINAIKMMHSIARYYNTSERMTALFVKITNQMITCCKNYINADGDLWEQDREKLVDKFHACIALNDAYEDTFQKTKQRLASQPKDKQFDFSEMYIFGKFKAFRARITKLIELFVTINQFSTLKDSSIEGMDEILRQFNVILNGMKGKHYDLLDHRHQEFDNDFTDFFQQIIDLEKLLQEFITVSFEPITSTERALALLEQFRSVLQRAAIRSELDNKYVVIFNNYGRELDSVRKIYERHAKAPPVPRDTPPYSGAIAWSRQLLRRIEQPMRLFEKHRMILHTQDAKKTIKVYNKLAEALFQFETLYHQQWCAKVPEVKDGLQATLLVKSTVLSESKREREILFVNFDPLIVRLIRETKAMQRMNLEVPEVARLICLQEEKYKTHYQQLQYMLEEYERVCGKVATSKTKMSTALACVQQLMKPRIDLVKAKMEPGLFSLTWTSLGFDEYISGVHKALEDLEGLIDKVHDMVECRANATLESIRNVELFNAVPKKGALWSPETFILAAEAQSVVAADVVDAKGLMVETAVRDLISLVTGSYSGEDMNRVDQYVERLFKEYASQCAEAVKDCCRSAIESLKNKIGVQLYGAGRPATVVEEGVRDALFGVEVSLVYPTISVAPSMDQLQEAINSVIVVLLNSTKKIYHWGQDRSKDVSSLKSYYLEISNNKEVSKLQRELSMGIGPIKSKVNGYLTRFEDFGFLWESKKEDTYQQFAAHSPTIDDFETELTKFTMMEADIQQIDVHSQILSINLDASPLITSLLAEAQAWKQLFGDQLKVRSQEDMQALLDFFEDATIKLNRQVNDLDEIRQVMKVLRELREAETAIEMRITPIEETYNCLTHYNIKYSKEEAESADNLRYSWKKLKQLAVEKQGQLMKLEPGFRSELSQALSEFKIDVEEFVAKYQRDGPMAAGVKPRVAVERLRAFQRLFEERERKRTIYNGGEELFGLPITKYPELDRIKKQLDLLEKLYGLYSDVIVTVNGYEDILWAELDIEAIQNEVKDFQDRCRRLPKQMKEWEAYLELKKTIDDFDTLMPLLGSMASPAVLQRHWDEISEVTRHTFKLDAETFKLKHLLQAPLLEHQDDIHEICFGARGEADVETKLRAIQDEWADYNFEFSTFLQRGNIVLNSEKTAEILQAIEESLMSLQALLSSRHNKPFKPEIQIWTVKLNTCLREIESWQHVQSLWIYLEAVFMTGDISRAMPVEAKRFANVDKQWVKIMNGVHETPNVVAYVYSDETLRNLLPHLADMLEMCQSSLKGYLESKQAIFPRFYFLSPPALLEVLGQANSNSHSIQPHLSSIFANVNQVKFSQTEYDTITHMKSLEGEEVRLRRPMECEGTVEMWLNTMVNEMKATVKYILQVGTRKMGSVDFQTFVKDEPAQVGLLGLQLMWTEQCETALAASSRDSTAMKARDKANWQTLNKLMELTMQDVEPMQRVKIETMVTIHLHQCEVFKNLVSKHIKSVEDFAWQQQARFYWSADQSDCVMRITENELTYCYEYLGCTDRLAITPLTDRCYITLASALGMSLGGAPAGPAGTGKTETVKDMGKSLGKYVVVFNCTPEHEYQQMEKIFKGIAMSGCWGDFDEFNRIKLPVLSVCAQQIQTIFQAKRDGKQKFRYTDGNMIALDKECGIFITMNPGYAGRQELPENLKLLFRTVAMMVPDRRIIMEVKLAAAGFLRCKELSTKFYWLYKMCEEQLSKQRHYDFGLRNILSVLRTCGKDKRTVARDDEEDVILQRVCRDMNLSKLVDDDYMLFLSLIEDLFQNKDIDTTGYTDLQAAISVVCEKRHLTNHPDWNLKIIQLYETARVRWGVMVLGPSGAGKTACIQTLIGALNETGLKYKEIRMNPKAIKAEQYLGTRDPGTNEWKDGVFSALWRKHNGQLKKSKGDNLWLTMDGPIDSLWIESLNTVLDDNKTLTLPNGDRLVMSPSLKLVFEVDSVMNASPATVSRAGMIYMSDKALGWEPIYSAWKMDKPPEVVGVLDGLFSTVYGLLFSFVKERLEEMMSVPAVSHITTTLALLQALLTPEITDPLHITRLFVWALAWGLGGLLDGRGGREKLSNELSNYDMLSLPPIDEESEDTVFNYLVDEQGEWAHWADRVPEYVYPKDRTPPFYEILVPTIASVRQEFIVDLLATQRRSVLLVGEPGTAKTVSLLEYLRKQDGDEYIAKLINFSSATHPNLFQSTMEGAVVKAHGLTWKPPGQKKMIVFIDDISMPEINEHGDQPTNEIVRQLMEQEGFYSLEKPGDFMAIKDLQFLAAMFHPGGGRHDIPNRLKRQFACFNATLPSAYSIDKIFSTIVSGYYSSSRGFHKDVVNLAPRLVPLTRQLWAMTKEKMLPTPEHFHYIFNLRDLSRITEGLVDGIPEVVAHPKALLMLWKHECERVLSDKLINKEHKTWFATSFQTMMGDEIGQPEAAEIMETFYCVDFLRDEPEVDMEDADNLDLEAPKIYEPISSVPSLRARLEYFLAQYNGVRGQNLDLVLFEDCIKHVVRVSRIIRRPRGNALLVGVGGSGKQSVTKLAASIAGHQIKQLMMTRAYNLTNFGDDLMDLYKTAGVAGKPTTFIFTDNDVKSNAFLEYINSILTSGEISGIIPKDELEGMYAELRPVLREEKPHQEDTSTNEAVHAFFIERFRNNLHVVLCFSPVGEKFRTRALKFPGLISGCTINWFEPWPKEALVAVAEKYLNVLHEKKVLVCSRAVKQAMIQYMCEVHFGVETTTTEYFERCRRHIYVTPKSYLNFINSYISVYRSKKNNIDNEAARMQTGLKALADAGVAVAKMQEELNVKKAKLAKAQEVAAKVLAEIQLSTHEAQKEADKVAKIKDAVMVKRNEAQAIANEAAIEVEKARPIYERAVAALQTIRPKDINELRAGNNPVDFTRRVLECVRILRYLPLEPVQYVPEQKNIQTSWSLSAVMMKRPDFLSSMTGYAKEELNGEMIEMLEAYFDTAGNDFGVVEGRLYGVEKAKTINAALVGVFQWIEAITEYYYVSQDMEPKILLQRRSERKLAIAEEDLARKQQILDEKQAELGLMQVKYEEAIDNKQKLLADAQRTEQTMMAASQLIEGLAEEKIRWSEISKTFGDTVQKLVGDVAVATAFLGYAGPFNQETRAILVAAWCRILSSHNIPFNRNMNVIDLLAESSTIGRWKLEGLPTDEQSIQNGIVVNNSSRRDARFPLLIDPQGQGHAWVLNHEAPNRIVRVKLEHRMFKETLENAVNNGRPLLIEHVGEELDPILDGVFEKGYKSGKNIMCRIGDKEVLMHPDFKLYLSTKFPNPRYPPEIFAKVSIIDFAVTMGGLEDQLLGRVIRAEKEELELQRSQLLEEVNSNKRQIKDLEDHLLTSLTGNTGNLVENTELIGVLQNTKRTSEDVQEKLVVAEETNQKITVAREEYRPVATRGAILYFLMAEMQIINAMYQSSLQQFLGVFDKSIGRAAKSHLPAQRIANIVEEITYNLYLYVARGLFEEHKMLFQLQMALRIDVASGAIEANEYRVFVKGGSSIDQNTVKRKPDDVPVESWLNLAALSDLPVFYDILNQVETNRELWLKWYNHEAPETAPIPDGYQERLDAFKRLLLVRCWAEDRMYFAARTYLKGSLGKRYIDAPPDALETALAESDNSTPVVCLLSLGSDPTENIRAMARKGKLPTPLEVSMGEGQEGPANRLLAEGFQSGTWVILGNSHLALTFMEGLVALIKNKTEVHEDFRLWITSEPIAEFPIALLQMSIKVTNEPPQGMQAGLAKTFSNHVTQDMLDRVDKIEWRPILFSICFLYSVLQERRKFGPMGWCVSYEFNQADLVACLNFLESHFFFNDSKKGVDWKNIRFMVCQVHFGGRVTDDYDRRLLATYGKKWLSVDVVNPQPAYAFSPKYAMPAAKTMEAYHEYIGARPDTDSPEIFGLHTSADIAYRSAQTKAILSTILSIQPKEGAGVGGETREAYVFRLCDQYLDRLPEDYVESEVREHIHVLKGFTVPLNIFLFQEIQRYQDVVSRVRSDLENLKLAIQGITILSESLMDVLNALYDGLVPNTWLKISWKSTGIGYWMSALEARYKQYDSWLKQDRPAKFWLAGFFNPQGFLTAVLQEYARSNEQHLTLDRIMPKTTITKKEGEARKLRMGEGVFITGLTMEGARWDRKGKNGVVDLVGKERGCDMPTIHFTGDVRHEVDEESLYKCPVYMTKTRTDAELITEIYLPSSQQHPDHWTMRGVALLASVQ